MCKTAWLLIRSCSDTRLYTLKRQASENSSVASGRTPKAPRHAPKYEMAVAFLTNYFASENGRCEKLPNPRYGRDEYRLPIWLTKEYVFRAYESDLTESTSKRDHLRCKQVAASVALTWTNCSTVLYHSKARFQNLVPSSLDGTVSPCCLIRKWFRVFSEMVFWEIQNGCFGNVFLGKHMFFVRKRCFLRNTLQTRKFKLI